MISFRLSKDDVTALRKATSISFSCGPTVTDGAKLGLFQKKRWSNKSVFDAPEQEAKRVLAPASPIDGDMLAHLDEVHFFSMFKSGGWKAI